MLFIFIVNIQENKKWSDVFWSSSVKKKNQPKYTKNKQQAYPSLIFIELHVEVGRLLNHLEDFNSFSSI